MPNLITEGVEAIELSPHCGTELRGVQIVCCNTYMLTDESSN